MRKLVTGMPRWVKWIVAILVLALMVSVAAMVATSSARAAGDPAQGPGGPILVITAGTSNHAPFYAEILRTEGLNAFSTVDIAAVTPEVLASHDVVLLGKMALTPAQVTLLANWVNAGGNLIAMAPDAQLASLLGITPTGTALANGYVLIDNSAAPGYGISAQTLQFHGSANLYSLNGATSLATLYSGPSSATVYPALTLRSVGSGRAAAFAYDLATSVVQTRQGNPAWATDERDGLRPVRSDDKFYGAKVGDVQPDWLDLTRVAIPQADEQQRWLANLILTLNASRKPLPRFWYFPNGKKAVVIMTGDDHGNGGTAARFEQFKAASPPGCSVANWECVRGTSYAYAITPISDAQAAQYDAEGFEIALHVNTGCADYSATSLEATYVQQLAQWGSVFPSLPAPLTQRHHCIVWSDWTSGAEVQFNHGMRLDTTYYHWPPAWVRDTPGVFTGSAMPMRFARLDGSLIDVYQAATQMTDESGQTYPYTVDTLLDRALGSEGYYGAYTVNAHTDFAASAAADAVVNSARARGVPVVSSRQMLSWLDGRNSSSFGSIGWSGGVLSFRITRGTGAVGLQAMLPTRNAGQALSGISRGGVAVPYTTNLIKGIEYAFFAADGGAYTATYGAAPAGPAIVSTSPVSGATGVANTVKPAVVFASAMDATSITSSSMELRDASGARVSASVGYDAASRTATLTPAATLADGSRYSAVLKGGSAEPRIKDASGVALAADLSWSFTTAVADTTQCPCGAWSSASVPGTAAEPDSAAVELGVRFRTDVDGYISGVRFYKGSGNGGTHIGNLWTTNGTRLASATFSNESATGWQQVNFATPVAVTANTVYVASYFAPQGRYAADLRYFASSGVDKPPVHLLRDGASGANGLYTYARSSTFPTSTYLSTNYWVDVVFTPGTLPPVEPPTPPAACATPANEVVAENCRTGNPPSEWDISGIGDRTIQGFATQISVNRGSTINFKVDSSAASYRFDIYRLGYYGGLGARKVATVSPSAALPQSQPACLDDLTTGLIDCGNWGNSGSWNVPADAVSGIYVARLVRADTGGASHIVFVVRNDASRSDLLFQTSDTTWQAYNNYGGNSLYSGSPAGRAYKVSYNRPFSTRAVDNGQDWLFNSEYPMLRWLEANGYDVSYTSGVDTDRNGALLLNHRAFLSVGHDEYWSGAQRSNVEAARNAGVHLAFFSGNEIFWKTRWENSIDANASAYRTLVSYKETAAGAKIDPSTVWTGTWRDPRFSPPADGGRPENALSGTIFMVNEGATSALVVPAADGKMRFWRNTSVATLAAGTSATLPDATLGYEWDIDADNGARPPGLVRMSSTTVANAPVLQDYGTTYATGSATHSLTLYRHASGALVFGAGTVQWPWGLDATHDRGNLPADLRMQQATVNLLADMNVQPANLQTASGLVAASASTDNIPPTSVITSPATGATVAANGNLTITGTAADSGGGVVGGVEVSVDGGTTWHPALGRANWSYTFRTPAPGTLVIRSRAVDDSGRLEVASAGVTINVSSSVPPVACPCTIWPSQTVPAVVSDSDTASVNLGVKFTTDTAGSITGLRFYKGPGNTGTHVGTLWSATGAVLAQATFTGETAGGWQQVNFATPVAVAANTVYVASYLAPVGRYAADEGYFANNGADNAPLHAPRSGISGGNGVYAYASSTVFPTSTFNATNYWVDVVFSSSTVTPPPPPPVSDITPPTVTATTPASGATGVSRSANLNATFSEAMNAASINSTSFQLRGPGGTLIPAVVSYSATNLRATLNPNPTLATLTSYTAVVHGGAGTQSVKDTAGNPLAVDRSWTFTTR